MAKIIDPDSLIRSTSQANLGVDGNIWIDTTYRMISLAEHGDLSSDGVTIQALYSYLKEEWKTDPDLIKFPFPMVAITPEQFEFVSSWQPASMDTVYLFKDGGFAVKDSNGDSSSEFAGIITLGSLGVTDQVYYLQSGSAIGISKDIYLTGAVNQCVKTYGYAESSSLNFINDSVAFAENDLGPNASEEVDCSTSYHLTITVDAEGPTEVNIQGATPAATTYDEIVTLINAQFTGTPMSKVGTGTAARLRIEGTATVTGNFVKIADGTTTSGTMALFTTRAGDMIDEAGDHVVAGEMITTFHPGDLITFAGTPTGTNDVTVRISNIRGDYMSMTCEPTAPGLTTQDATGSLVTMTADARDYFKIFAREYQKQYAQSELGDIGVSELTYQAYRFPLANSDDLKITNDDTTVGGSLPYTDMDITYLEGVGFGAWADGATYPANTVVSDGGRWYLTALGGTTSGTGVGDDTGVTDWAAFSGERDIGGTYYAFNIIVDADVADDGNLPTAEEIYEFVQYSLRQNADIDAGAGDVTGKTANVLLNFVGDTLVTESGVFIDQFSATDINRLEFYDYDGVKRVFPFVSAGTINFNDNLTSDSDPVYKMFFTNNDAGDNDGSDFGTSNAIIVQDNSATDIAGAVTGSQVQFTYDYDGNVQRGTGSNSTDAPVTIVAIGLDKAQYVKATGTIGRSNANSFSLVASLERNYSNPV